MRNHGKSRALAPRDLAKLLTGTFPTESKSNHIAQAVILAVLVMSNPAQHRSASPLAANETTNESDDDVSSFPPSPLNETRPRTPIVKRIASLRLPHDHSEKELAELAPLLEVDLEGNIMDSEPDLFTNLFPNSILPFQINEKLLNSLPSNLYNSKKYSWVLKGANTESVRKSLVRQLRLHWQELKSTQYIDFLQLLEQVMHQHCSINKDTSKTGVDRRLP